MVPVSATVTGIGFGATDEIVDINGSTALFSPMGNQVTAGGVLALPSNIGHYDRTIFTVVPEVGINLAVNVTPHMQLTAGYSFLYWNQVVRPAASGSTTACQHERSRRMPSFGSATGPSGRYSIQRQRTGFMLWPSCRSPLPKSEPDLELYKNGPLGASRGDVCASPGGRLFCSPVILAIYLVVVRLTDIEYPA